MLAVAPIMEPLGLPMALALYLGAFLGVLPVQLGILYYLGWRRNGRLSLKGVVLLRQRVSAGKMLLLVLGTLVWAALVFALLGSRLDGLLRPAFAWMPSFLRTASEDFSAFPRTVALVTWAVGVVGTAWLAPFVEELYFRGFLLPRMPVSSTSAALVHAALFSLYHFWSPWQVLTRIVAVTPMTYAVQKSRSIWVSVFTHLLLNTVAMSASLASILQ
jgi:membrane protease YdiL (CAAX protease family)